MKAEKFVIDFADYLICMEKRVADSLKVVYPEWEELCKRRIERINQIVEQCEYGYISDVCAVKQLANVDEEITLQKRGKRKC